MPLSSDRVSIDGMPEAAAAPLVEPRPPRKLYRSSDGRWLGGVARGLAGHLRSTRWTPSAQAEPTGRYGHTPYS